jgi:hypothetical protein
MNTKVLLLGAVVAAFTLTTFAAEPLLTPRTAGNQAKTIQNADATPAVTVVVAAPVLRSPRAAANQIQVVTGGNNDLNRAATCQKNMDGSPKIVAQCSAHTTMPGCATVAMEK